MPLSPGTRIGAYEITSQLGAGGMGEVYRAKDSKLKREVALKVLPADVANDRERLARFQREAEVLASLNHPNIAHIHGLEEATGTTALVMELVEGEDLAERLKRGPIPLDEALPIAKQIAEALEAAHEQAIIHRDLKPANIKVRPDGTVKVLDFGLAKALETGVGNREAGAGNTLANSPTITSPAMTMHGMILGTAAYMAPEQAKGKAVDKRADIWAFGVVLYEMLTGVRAFAGEDTTDVLAAVVRAEPEWNRLPADLSPMLGVFLRRCLQKDARQRIGDIHDVRLALDGAFEIATPAAMPAGTAQRTSPMWRRALPYFATAVAGAAALALVASQSGWRQAPATTVSRLSIAGAGDFDEIAISPDGSRVLIRAGDTLSLRSMVNVEVVPLKLAATGIGNAVFSPDGQSIGFTAGLTLKRTTTAGIAMVDLATLPAEATGCQWSGDHIYCAVGAKGIVRVAAAGGAVEQVITLAAGEVAATPALVAGGSTMLFALAPGAERGDWTRSSIVAQSLSSQTRNVIAAAGSDPHYLPTNQVAYVVEGIWFAVDFDPKAARAIGAPTAVLEGVGRVTQGGLLQPRARIDLSTTGTLVYARGPLTISSGGRQVIMTDRTGAERVLPIEPRDFESPRISPDGRQLAISTDNTKEAVVWIYDLAGGRALRRLTFTGRNRLPVWSPDGKRLAFQSDRGGDTAIYVQAADGSSEAERWTTAAAGTAHVPETWSRDGRYLAFSSVTQNGADLWLRSIGNGEAARFSDLHSSAPLNAAFSPDGKWIAYTLRGNGGAVFVQPVPATGAKYQISSDTSGAHHPFWASSGKELFYWRLGQMLATTMPASGPSSLGPAVPVPGDHPSNMTAVGPLNYDITPDGRYFVLTRPIGAPAATGSIDVVLNWLAEMEMNARP
jgi:Tol biopolymer transport system component